MNKLKSTVLGLMMMSIVLAGIIGCGGGDDGDGGGGGSADISPDVLVRTVTAAEEEIQTVSFNMEMTMKASGEGMGESFSMDMDADGSGRMDYAAEKMQMDMNMDMGMDMGQMGDMDMEMDMEIYLIGDTMYMKSSEVMGMPEQWVKMESPGTWDQQDMVAQQTELLENADMTITDGGKVNGVRCYKVDIKPDMETFYEAMMQQPGLNEGMGGSGLPEDMDPSELSEMIEDFSVVQWYAKDTFYPMKVEMVMDMVITSEMMGEMAGGGEMDMDMAISMNFKDYNQPVSIELPAEAQGAMDMDDMPGMGGMGF